MARKGHGLPLDRATWDRVIKAQYDTSRSGNDLAEELNRRSLLWTPAVDLSIRRGVLNLLHLTLTETRPVEMLRRRYSPGHSVTPAEMYEVTVDFVHDFMLSQEEK